MALKSLVEIVITPQLWLIGYDQLRHFDSWCAMDMQQEP
jgi:nicotinic acid mononucleotide adenylyltransferase